jgi:hypothetical protein
VAEIIAVGASQASRSPSMIAEATCDGPSREKFRAWIRPELFLGSSNEVVEAVYAGPVRLHYHPNRLVYMRPGAIIELVVSGSQSWPDWNKVLQGAIPIGKSAELWEAFRFMHATADLATARQPAYRHCMFSDLRDYYRLMLLLREAACRNARILFDRKETLEVFLAGWITPLTGEAGPAAEAHRRALSDLLDE